MPSDEKVEKLARAIRELKPFEDGVENVEYIIIRGLSAIGFQLPAAGAQDLAEDIARAALAAAEAGEQPVAWERRKADMPNGATGDWQKCSTSEATGHFERRPGYEYRTLYASPPSEASRDERAAIRAFLEAAAEDENVRLKVECAMSGRHWSESARLGILAPKEAVDDLTNATAIRARGKTAPNAKKPDPA